MRLALFASGGGTNCQAILDAIAEGTLDATAVCLITDRAGCGALERAAAADLPSFVITPRSYADPQAFGRALLDALRKHDATFVALAGYLSKIPPAVVDAFKHRMVNVHPSLLPAFGGRGMYGHHVHEAVLAYGARWSGVTIHVVDEHYDHGPVVLQEPVPVYPDDTPKSLARRIHPVEHRLYPHALQRFAASEVQIDGRHVRFTPPHDPTSSAPTHD